MSNLPAPTLAAPVTGFPISQSYLTSQLYNPMTFALNPPLFFGLCTVSNSIATTGTAIKLDTEVIDTYDGHSTVSNTTRYTAQVPGVYMVNGAFAFGGATSQTEAGAYITKNGTEVQGSRCVSVANSSHTYVVQTTNALVQMGIGDYLEVFGYADQTLNTSTSSSFSSLTVNFLHL